MTQLVRVQNFNVSSDGYGSGEGQSLDRPFGHADPAALFFWAGATAHWPTRTDPGGTYGLDDYCTRDFTNNIGAEIMGRNKFGPQRGPWENYDWQGWWGDEPPFHTPVFVLTHRPPDEPDPGVTFLTGELEEAVATARAAAGGKNLEILGADVASQCLQRGLVDEVLVYVLPVLLGDGVRFSTSGLGRIDLEPFSNEQSGAVTMLRFRVRK